MLILMNLVLEWSNFPLGEFYIIPKTVVELLHLDLTY